MTDFPTLSNTSSSEIPTLSYTWKKYPFRQSLPVLAIIGNSSLQVRVYAAQDPKPYPI